jgi:hypothetical protein
MRISPPINQSAVHGKDNMSSKPEYEVVSPVGEQSRPQSRTEAGPKYVPSAAPLNTLAGKKIGLVWTNFRNGDVLLEALADLLGRRFGTAEFLKLPSGRTLRWGDHPDESIASLAREHGIDAAIVAPGC